MKKILHCILIILPIFLMYGCNSTENYTIPKTINQSIVNYFGGFKAGSWWVYSDSAGNIDSAYVKSYNRTGGTTVKVQTKWYGIDGGGFGTRYPNDNITITLVSKLQRTWYYYIDGNAGECQVDCGTYEKVDSPYATPIFELFMEIDSNDSIKYSSDQIFGFLPIKGQTIHFFDHFYKSAIEVSSPPLTDSLPMYFAQNYGIVQKTIHGHTYYLKKYNIVN